MIDGEEECSRLATANLQQVRSTEVKMHWVSECLAGEADAERAAHQAFRPVAPDQILSLDALLLAVREINDVRAHAAFGPLERFTPTPRTQDHARTSAG